MSVLENGSEILKISPKTYNRISNLQKCASELNCDMYVYDELIYHKLTNQNIYNRNNFISAIFSCSCPENIDDIVQKHVKASPINQSQQTRFYQEGEGFYRLLFIPNFDPHKTNDVFGFTIDQIYYDAQKNIIIDTSNLGIQHLQNIPIIIKSTVSEKNWNEELIMGFVYKVGTFLDNKIDEHDLSKLKSFTPHKLNGLETIFWMNRPGTALQFLLDLYPASQQWIFELILKVCEKYNVDISENTKPSQVFSPKKIKLLNLYSDYFIVSGSRTDKMQRDIIFSKILLDL